MTDYIILALCIIIILAYIFDISSRFSKIPGVILLIALGITIQVISRASGLTIPNLKPLLPVMGTLGLIMIVMEASLDIELSKNKKRLLINSVSSAFVLFAAFVTIFSIILMNSLLNSIPFGIISSAVAIPSAFGLSQSEKEFVVYESSFSDIIGIMLFDFILFTESSIGMGIFIFIRDGIITVIMALIFTAVLGYLLHKISDHVNYVIILTFIVLIYSLAKLIHMPGLLLILIFGLTLANNKFLKIDIIEKFVDFPKLSNDISSFKKILGELTFLVRSFFFIMFGFYTQLNNLFSLKNILTGISITVGIFLLRYLYLKLILRLPALPMVFFAPRGLITILLFISIPEAARLPLISEEVVTCVILLTIFIMGIGNLLVKKEIIPS
jgi:cell volume regulation protein A